MPVITLTSDWGIKDYYAATVKGKILSYLPTASVVDISHLVPPFDLVRAAIMIKYTFENFPTGSVHIIGVEEEASIETPHLLVLYRGHFFIGADNGIFSLLCDEKPEKVLELNVSQDSDYFTFPSRDVFAKVACHIAGGGKIDELGEDAEIKNKKLAIKPVIDGNTIRGSVIYIDSYENVITNISEKLFKEKVKKKNFSIVLPSKNKINKISMSFRDVRKMDLIAFFNTLGLLEIAINNGKVASLLGLGLDSIIRIEIE
jgi:S-adenosyl-L-methionine hydrolase (adenosine-forming)